MRPRLRTISLIALPIALIAGFFVVSHIGKRREQSDVTWNKSYLAKREQEFEKRLDQIKVGDSYDQVHEVFPHIEGNLDDGSGELFISIRVDYDENTYSVNTTLRRQYFLFSDHSLVKTGKSKSFLHGDRFGISKRTYYFKRAWKSHRMD